VWISLSDEREAAFAAWRTVDGTTVSFRHGGVCAAKFNGPV